MISNIIYHSFHYTSKDTYIFYFSIKNFPFQEMDIVIALALSLPKELTVSVALF